MFFAITSGASPLTKYSATNFSFSSGVSNFESVFVNIYKDSQDVSSIFDIEYNDSNKTITISWNPTNYNFAPSSTNFSKDSRMFFGGGTYAIHIFEDLNLRFLI